MPTKGNRRRVTKTGHPTGILSRSCRLSGHPRAARRSFSRALLHRLRIALNLQMYRGRLLRQRPRRNHCGRRRTVQPLRQLRAERKFQRKHQRSARGLRPNLRRCRGRRATVCRRMRASRRAGCCRGNRWKSTRNLQGSEKPTIRLIVRILRPERHGAQAGRRCLRITGALLIRCRCQRKPDLMRCNSRSEACSTRSSTSSKPDAPP